MVTSQTQSTTLKFPVLSLRRIPSPADDSGLKTYIAVVNVRKLPDLSAWREINVRDAKTTGYVPKAIRKTLDEAPGDFLFKNRGLVITVETAKYDNESGMVTIELADPEKHGLLDGGHTYKVINEYCDAVDGDDPEVEQAYIRVEVLEGFSSEQIQDIVDARNTSNQVKDQSLMELANSFDGIKQAIKDKPYSKLVGYKEYEILEGSDGKTAKPIDIREIVALMTTFDKDHFGDSVHPIVAYSQKAACLKRFKDSPKSYEKIYPILTDILCLWDKIHRDMRGWYESFKTKQGQGSKFGKINGVIPERNVPLLFSGEVAEDIIPTSFKFPVLAALRAFVEESEGKYHWGMDATAALDNGLGEQLAEAVISNASELRNPTKLGKTNSVWDQCYSKAQVWYLKAQASKYNMN